MGMGMGWDGMGWDGMGWDGMGWDGMGWDGMGWDGMGWDGMGWDGMGWDGMGWDEMGWIYRYSLCQFEAKKDLMKFLDNIVSFQVHKNIILLDIELHHTTKYIYILSFL